jgi:V8-like Glu-specific endopeptidase
MSTAYDDVPLTAAQLVALDDKPIEPGSRTRGLDTSPPVYWPEDDSEVTLVPSGDYNGAFRVRSSTVLHAGLPVRESMEQPVRTRTMAERLDAAALRHRVGKPARQRDTSGRPELAAIPPFRPGDIPSGMHPKVMTSLHETRTGINARGRKTLLSQHSTIIDGESRSLVYPDRFPYTAVCKLYVRYQPTTGGSYVLASEATGYIIGPRTMMTAGHVRPPPGRPWHIEVIPACWNGQSIYGPGLVTYVSDTAWWNSDSGSDIQICRLYDAIGDRTGSFGVRHYDSSWEDGDYWTMAGFPYDVSLTSMSRETQIAVRDDDDGDDINVNGSSYDTTQVESDADEASGVSGAPLWGWWGEDPFAIGVHHGVEHDGTITGTETLSCAAGGDGFVAAAHWARSRWP